MTSAEPKSGKLFKLGHGLFGSKWTEKWVHLDGHVLKYFSMASEQQPLFSLTSARQSYAIELASYDFVLSDDKRITRKHAFHLVPKNKNAKSYVFACANERELTEWQEAFQPRVDPSADSSVSPIVVEKMRRASEAFTVCDPRRTDKVDASKLRVLLQSVGWQGDISEYSLLQQQLDPNVEGTISRAQYLRVMKQYWVARDKSTSQTERSYVQKDPATTPRGSFSDRPPRYPKRSEANEPEIVSDVEPTNDEEHNVPASTHSEVAATRIPENHTEEEASCRHWQQEFEDFCVQQAGTSVLQRGLQMAAFITEFRLEAEQTMQEIVEEMTLDDDARKIPPMELDDDQLLATDYSSELESLRQHITKFAVRGLLVYVTHDPFVHKIFGHQLRAAKALHAAIIEEDAGIDRLGLPLQCVVDYLGFRALVIAQPSQGSTRIDSSRTLTAFDSALQERCHDRLKAVYSRVGIFVDDLSRDTKRRYDQLPNYVGASTGVWISAVAKNPPLVIHNTFDTFPADPFQVGTSNVDGLQKLRPEFVAQYGGEIPLCAAMPVNVTAVQAELLKGAALSAHEHLRTIVVPAFVDFVEANVSQIYDSATLTVALHREGINARYLGLCYEAATSKHTKRLVWSEIIARACKHELRASLQTVFRDTVNDVRRVVRAASVSAVDEEDGDLDSDHVDELRRVDSVQLQAVSREVVQETTQRVLLEFFNLVFAHGSADSRAFWKEHLLPRVQEQFVFDNDGHIHDDLEHLLDEEHLHWPQVLQAVQFHTNVLIDDPRAIKFASSVPVGHVTVISALPRSKVICRTTSACEKLLEIQDGSVDLDAINAQLAISDAAPVDERSPPIGHLLIAAAEVSLNGGLSEEAGEYVKLAMEATQHHGMLHARALLTQIKVKHCEGTSLDKLLTLFGSAVELVKQSVGPMHPFLFDFYMTMMEIATATGDNGTAKDLFSDAAGLIKDCYGRHSLAYADIRRREGEALVESGYHDEAMSIFDEALAVYERIKQELDPLDREAIREIEAHRASCIYLTAELQAQQATPNALEIAFSSAVRAHTIREEVLPPNHADRLSSLLQLGELCLALGDLYRAQEYYRPALTKLKELKLHDEQVINQFNKVTHAVLSLHLRSLPTEKQSLVDRVRKRYADTISAFADTAARLPAENDNDNAPNEEAERELRLLRSAMRQLLERDPVEYVNSLIEKTESELQAQHRQRFASGTLRRESAAEEPLASPLRSPLSPSGTSRFASFAFGQPPQHSSRPSSQLPQANGVASPSRGTLSMATTSDWSPMLATSGGDFTSGGQLAAVLYLASLNDQL